ncbi:MAG: hypothetical protein WCJ40_21165 [Planctomycetota bacterium]
MNQSLRIPIRWLTRRKRFIGISIVILASNLILAFAVINLLSARIATHRFRDQALEVAKFELSIRELLNKSSAEKDELLIYSNSYLEDLTWTTFLMRHAGFRRSMYEEASRGDSDMIRLAREAGGLAGYPYYDVICDNRPLPGGEVLKQLDDLSKEAIPEIVLKSGRCHIADFYARRAGYAIYVRDYESALLSMNEAIRSDTKNSTLFVLRGWIRYQKGDFQDAQSDFLAASVLSPKYFESWVLLCETYLSMNPPDPSAAITSLKQAMINIDGGLIPTMQFLDRIIPVRAYSRLAWIVSTIDHDGLRDPILAIKICNRLLTKTSFSKEMKYELLRSRAAAYAASGQFDRAIADQTEAIGIFTGSTNAQAVNDLNLFHKMMPLRRPIDPIRQLYLSKQFSLAEPLPRPSIKL